MILHYLKIGWRNLLKYKTQSIITVFGLSVGVLFFAYGYHWYQYETSYDSFHPDADRIYRVFGIHKGSNQQYEFGTVPYVAVEKIEAAFPEIEQVAVQYPAYVSRVSHEGEQLGRAGFTSVDERFIRMFPPKLVAGEINNQTFINQNDVILTESFARKYFGTPENSVKKILTAYDDEYIVQAVIKDLPKHSIFQGDGYITDVYSRKLISETLDEVIKWRHRHGVVLFVKLHKKIDLKAFERKLKTFAVDNNYNDDLLFSLAPLSAVKYKVINAYVKNAFEIKYIYTFIFTALLLIAAVLFNYLNILIQTVRSRVREINLRRVSGASIADIWKQVAVEILLMGLLVSFFSFLILELTSSRFEQLFSTTVVPEKIKFILISTILAVFITLYLLLMLSSFLFVRKALIREFVESRVNISSGKMSLVLQLLVSMFFIFSAWVFYRQVKFMREGDWGFRTENTLQLKMDVENQNGLLKEIKKLPMVEHITHTSFFHIESSLEDIVYTRANEVEWIGKDENFNPFFQFFGVEKDFVNSMGLTLIQGRDFIESDLIKAQPDKVFINETAQRVMQMENPVGEKISVASRWYSYDGHAKIEYEIIGVVKDFHTLGLQTEIQPLIIVGEPHRDGGFFNYLHIKEGTEEEALRAIRDLIPNFEPADVDEEMVRPMRAILDDVSKTEHDVSKLFFIVSIFSILIALFGVYSVSQREMQRRQKEVAVRKVVGAGTKEIMGLFFREYITIVLISSVLALPSAWLFSHRWLQTFAYRITVFWWMFVLAVLLVIAIVVLAIFAQVYKAANQNPPEVLQSN